ncbi:nuclear transport factor 2 family protein [Bailinhaonella thermotolerans]|uniref:Nuclear transport factor 2 family protein n=1 Tax=Bailinhaonella thermotolerans TaxID=1070861 RepID=A0A3A4B4G8_9ACTN|nr:nuclear transport factor 2 family protein [Bailinhaonella thermotolerans]
MPPTVDGFEPTAEDVASVHEWFARYDALAAKGDVEGMADMAMFPLNSVTDNAAGNGSARQSSREEFVREMAGVVGDGAEMRSVRTPHFLSKGLVFVITEATVEVDGVTHRLRYGDLLVRRDGAWHFQTMVQGGWGE